VVSGVRISSSTNSSKWPPKVPRNDVFSTNSCSVPNTAVTAVQKGDNPARALQQLLGQDHLATTEIYLNLGSEHVIKEFTDKQ
jgi:hypothetical protein